MTDLKTLNELVYNSGYKMQFIAQKCGLSYQGFLNKLKGESEFKTAEAGILKDLLRMSDATFQRVFFAGDVGKKPTRKGVTD